MTKEAYCSYEVSKLLKKNGFNEECTHYYDVDDGIEYTNGARVINSNTETYFVSPTHQMAMAWLREKHFIIVVTPVLFNVDYENSKWGYDIWADDNLEVSAEDCRKPLATYEEATEEALKYVLENQL